MRRRNRVPHETEALTSRLGVAAVAGWEVEANDCVAYWFAGSVLHMPSNGHRLFEPENVSCGQRQLIIGSPRVELLDKSILERPDVQASELAVGERHNAETFLIGDQIIPASPFTVPCI